MFFLWALGCSALKPVVIIPSHFGSRLHVTTTRKPYWYCPKEVKNQHVWIRVRDIFRPYLNCVLDWLTVDLDEETGKLKSQDNTTMMTVDFGGLDGIRGIGPEYFGEYLPVNYEAIIDSFLSRGYVVKKDFFSAPYDWRFGLDQPDSYFDAFQELIEHAYNLNGQVKVALLAHGMGCSLTHLFLTEKMTKEWRNKYIDSATYVSPSWTGSGQSLFSTWRLRYPYIHMEFDSLQKFVASIGAFHAQLPNAVAYANTTLLVTPDGNNHTGAELIDILRQHSKLTGKQLRIAERNFKFSQELPKTPDFNVNIVYNSGVTTPMGLRLKSWNDVGRPIYGKGDSLVGSKLTEWACETWQNYGIRLRCRDLLSSEKQYYHRYIIKTPEIVSLVTEWIVGEIKNVGERFSTEL